MLVYGLRYEWVKIKRALFVVIVGLFWLSGLYSQAGTGKNLIFYLPFEGSAEPGVAEGSKECEGKEKAKFVPGKDGQGLSIGLDESGIKYESQSNLNLSEGTIALWYKPNWGGKYEKQERLPHSLFECAHYKKISEKGLVMKDGIRLIATRSYRVSFDITDDNGNYHQTETRHTYTQHWKPGRWYHIVCTWDTDGDVSLGYKKLMALYIDGEVIDHGSEIKNTTNEHNFMLTETAPEMIIGSTVHLRKRERSLNSADGVIDELSIYGKALSHKQVRELFLKCQKGTE